jgi:hypothetical protein
MAQRRKGVTAQWLKGSVAQQEMKNLSQKLNRGAIPPTNLIRDIKRSSAMFINNEVRSYLRFSWQEGFGAFTIGYRELDQVYKYIVNQKEHYMEKNFSGTAPRF